MPPILYKYLDIAGAIKTLATCALRFSPPTTFNDPFDIDIRPWEQIRWSEINAEIARTILRLVHQKDAPTFVRRTGISEIVESIRSGTASLPVFEELLELSDRAFAQMGNAAQETFAPAHDRLLGRLRVCCFSETRTSVPMWAHYADRHRGCVLGFSVEAASGLLNDARQVKYTPTPPPLGSVKDWVNIITGLTDRLTDPSADFIFWKAPEWSYEREWRVVKGVVEGQPVAPVLAEFDVSALREVSVGMMTDPMDQAAITALVKSTYPHAAVQRATADRSSWSLKICSADARERTA